MSEYQTIRITHKTKGQEMVENWLLLLCFILFILLIVAMILGFILSQAGVPDKIVIQICGGVASVLGAYLTHKWLF